MVRVSGAFLPVDKLITVEGLVLVHSRMCAISVPYVTREFGLLISPFPLTSSYGPGIVSIYLAFG